MKEESVSANIEQSFGYKRNGCRFSTCIKCRNKKTNMDIIADAAPSANDQPSPHLMLVCGKCKCKKELTTDKIYQHISEIKATDTDLQIVSNVD